MTGDRQAQIPIYLPVNIGWSTLRRNDALLRTPAKTLQTIWLGNTVDMPQRRIVSCAGFRQRADPESAEH
jgi:hypothetical protein